MTFRGSHLYANGPEIQGVFGVTSLPLTTVAHIISYVRRPVPRLSASALPVLDIDSPQKARWRRRLPLATMSDLPLPVLHDRPSPLAIRCPDILYLHPLQR